MGHSGGRDRAPFYRYGHRWLYRPIRDALRISRLTAVGAADCQSAHSAWPGVVSDEVRDRWGDLVAIGACLGEFGRDVFSHVARPALGGVESNDADRGRILAL